MTIRNNKIMNKGSEKSIIFGDLSDADSPDKGLVGKVDELRDALLGTIGALEAMAPVAEQFFIGIDRDIHKELPGLRSVYANAKAALRKE